MAWALGLELWSSQPQRSSRLVLALAGLVMAVIATTAAVALVLALAGLVMAVVTATATIVTRALAGLVMIVVATVARS